MTDRGLLKSHVIFRMVLVEGESKGGGGGVRSRAAVRRTA